IRELHSPRIHPLRFGGNGALPAPADSIIHERRSKAGAGVRLGTASQRSRTETRGQPPSGYVSSTVRTPAASSKLLVAADGACVATTSSSVASGRPGHAWMPMRSRRHVRTISRPDEERVPAVAAGRDAFLRVSLRGQDLNLRPSGYEPDELPDCST